MDALKRGGWKSGVKGKNRKPLPSMQAGEKKQGITSVREQLAEKKKSVGEKLKREGKFKGLKGRAGDKEGSWD